MNPTSKRTVLVTGGAQGIGRAIVSSFLRSGDRVFFVDVDQEKGTAWQEECQRNGGEAFFICGDVSVEEDVQRAMREVENKAGELHVLINNAGVSWFTPLLTSDTAVFDRVLAINLRGPYLFSKYAAPLLMESGKKGKQGVIIHISSTRALMSEPHNEAYAASKGGLLALTHALANSLGPWVRVNAICPGWIDTHGGQDLRPADHAQHPAGRVGKPEDIAFACQFLASEQAAFITGQHLVVDGGMTIKMQYLE